MPAQHSALSTQHSSRHVVIAGGGIAGLATAYELQERARAAGLPLTYTVLESNAALGGKIVTEHVPSPVGEFVVEGGPDSFLTQKPWATELCRRLGLGDDLIGTNDTQRTVFILNDGRLVPMPEGLALIVPTRLVPFLKSRLISWPGKLRMALDLAIPRRRDPGDESLADFVRRRLGREALEKLAEPLMSGIHAAAPERQSLLATFPRFRDLETRHRSLIRGMVAQSKAGSGHEGRGRAASPHPRSAFLSLRGGVAQLVQALERALTDGQLLRNVRVTGIERLNGAGYRVLTGAGTSIEADAVVLATPAYVSAALVDDLVPALAEALSSIRYVSTATVSLGFRREDVAHPLNGFGFVIPRRERRRIFGCTWTSTKFDHRAPPQGVLLRCFVGGAGREQFLAQSDEELVALARDELRAIMRIEAEPIITRVFRWDRANPQYDVGHLDRVREMYALCASQPGLFLAGSAFEGVGLPDCVRQAHQSAGKVLDYLRHSRDVLSVIQESP